MSLSVIIPSAKNTEVSVIKSIQKQKDKINLHIEVGPNPSKNRNKGVEKAKTAFVAFTNAHSILSENWSEEVKSFFKKYPEIDIVGGPQLTHKDERGFAKISGYALNSLFGSGGIATRYFPSKLNLNADETQLTSANLICRRRVFKKIKFDEKIYPGEDPKFISDAKKEGFKVAYSPHIIVYNKRRQNFSRFIKQVFNYGKVRPQKEKLLKTFSRPYFLIPSFFLIYLLILPSLFLLNEIFLLPLAFYLLFSFLFTVFNATINRSILALILLPLIYFTIHLSYGAGFLYGLLIRRPGPS